MREDIQKRFESEVGLENINEDDREVIKITNDFYNSLNKLRKLGV